jgi:lysophospholipase L1-like esterase
LALVIGRNGPRREWDALADAVYRSVDTLTVPVLDLWQRLRRESPRDIQVLEKLDGHPNERAHAIIATEVEAFLGRHGLLPRAGHVYAR